MIRTYVLKAQVFWGANMSTGNEQPKMGCVTLNMKRLRYLCTSVTVTNRHDVNIPEGLNLHKHAVKVADLAWVYFVNNTSIARCSRCSHPQKRHHSLCLLLHSNSLLWRKCDPSWQVARNIDNRAGEFWQLSFNTQRGIHKNYMSKKRKWNKIKSKVE